MTSHAAVVARGMGKCAIVGCKEIHVDLERKCFSVDGTEVSEGEWLTLDGATGRVFVGDLSTVPSEVVRVTNGTLVARGPSISLTPTPRLALSTTLACVRPRIRPRRAHRRLRRKASALLTEHMFWGRPDYGHALNDLAREKGRRRAW